MNELALFAGAGGGILGGHLLGWRTVCAVEFAAYPRRVLLARQRDGMLPRFPIWDDVRTFDGKPWRGRVDVVSGGFPCTDISSAGKGAGIEGEKSGLWKEMARIICEVQPRFAFVENSPMLLSRGFGTVLGDLAEMGFDARWGVLGAGRYGAPHDRERVWVLGRNTNLPEYEGDYTEPEIFRRAIAYAGVPSKIEWWETEPRMGRVADGVGNRVDRATAIGNGQVPCVVASAWRILTHNVKLSTGQQHEEKL